MTAIWNAIGQFFTEMMPVIKSIGRMSNFIFVMIGAIGIFGWITYMIKNKEDKGKYHTRF